jgi:hypothetical protein
MKKPKQHRTCASRRDFLKSAGGAAAIAAVGFRADAAAAADLPKLDGADATAVALKYTHDAASVDEAVRPQKDRFCNNCALYAGGEDDAWAGCSIFPGKAVAGRGWCSVWAPRQPS